MKFIKYHAIGNDYLVYDSPEPFALSVANISRVCDRHFGIGSDGILLLDPRQGDEFPLRIINPDGSEAEKSGNGLRIFSRYLWDRGYVGDAPFAILTPGGRVTSQVFDNGNSVEVSMGQANFSAAAVPVALDCKEVIDYPLTILGREFRINSVSMGNPHCVIFLDQIDSELAKTIGPEIERHPMFPRRTNVQFVKILDRNNIRIEIWERGAGYTLSSGSSSCAAVSMARRHGFCDARVCAHMPGGNLEIQVDQDFNVVMRGPVQRIAAMELDSRYLANE